MAEVESAKPPTLSEQYSLENEEKRDMGTKPVEVTKVEKPASEEVVTEKTEETPAAAEESGEVTPAAVEESSGATPPAAGENNEATEAAAEEGSETAEQEDSGDQEVVDQTPEIKIETAPADFRFPTTNQTRHCFTRYVEYHRCTAAKGEGAPECDKFAKYYRSLCPGEWIDRWNEQRENGTFPGPL
ncbi:hypothetical protein L1049_026157 [Liquidambar formosana]|uniref:Cytochrome c oxidase subunit 6b-1 n=1 Tax=Liquidambar formosana TaxID=63359 RepID=A0AAP0NEF3_LIQFO